MQSAVRTRAPALGASAAAGPLSAPRLFAAGRVALTFAAPAPADLSEQARDVSAAAKKKGVRLIVTVECTEARGLGETPSRYVTQKNRRNTPERLEISKYNPNLRRHTVHREVK